MEVVRITLKNLKASGQPRPLITEAVDKLASSIKEVGLIQPIAVRECDVMDGGIATTGYQIVAGHHRVAAVRALGWSEIDAIVIEASEYLQAELIEIDENLQRSELTPAQRAYAIKRRKEIWEALHPSTGGTNCPSSLSDGRKAGPQHEQGFAAETASVSGETKRDVNRHIARAEALGPAINDVIGTSLDKGVELDALKAMPEPERNELIERAKAGEQVSARQVVAEKKQEKPSALAAVRKMDDDALIKFLFLVQDKGVTDALKTLEG